MLDTHKEVSDTRKEVVDTHTEVLGTRKEVSYTRAGHTWGHKDALDTYWIRMRLHQSRREWRDMHHAADFFSYISWKWIRNGRQRARWEPLW